MIYLDNAATTATYREAGEIMFAREKANILTRRHFTAKP